MFATPAAVEWLTLLEALEQPHRSTRVSAAAASPASSGTPPPTSTRAATTSPTRWPTRCGRGWSCSPSRGLAAVLEAATVGGLPARVLAEVGGERRLTDLRHIGEALHEAALDRAARPGVPADLAARAGRRGPGRPRAGADPPPRLRRGRRAAGDDPRQQGPGVPRRLPARRRRPARRRPGPAALPRRRRASAAATSAAGGAGWADSVRRAQEEDAGEWLRLLYVAVTRAQCQVVCWWSPTKNTEASPLHRMLMRAADTSEVPDRPPVPSDDEVVRAVRASGAIAAARRPSRASRPSSPAPARRIGGGALDVRRFTRTVDAAWRRTSYSSLSAVRAEVVVDAVTSEPEVVGKDDERDAARWASRTGLDGPSSRPGERSALPDGEPPRRRDVRVAGARGAGAHRPRGAGPARRAARSHRRAARLVAGRARPRGAGRRAGRGVRLAAGRAGLRAGGGHAARRPAVRPAARDGLRAAARRRGRPGPRRCRRAAVGPGPDPRAAPAGGRPGAGVRRAVARPARRPAAAGLPHRLGRRGAAGADAGRAALPRRRLQDQLARARWTSR